MIFFIHQTPSKKKLEIVTIASNYHIEVNPSDVGFYDRVIIQELIKTVASSMQLDSSGQREFKGMQDWNLIAFYKVTLSLELL